MWHVKLVWKILAFCQIKLCELLFLHYEDNFFNPLVQPVYTPYKMKIERK